jgi:hypothetical protein
MFGGFARQCRLLYTISVGMHPAKDRLVLWRVNQDGKILAGRFLELSLRIRSAKRRIWTYMVQMQNGHGPLDPPHLRMRNCI